MFQKTPARHGKIGLLCLRNVLASRQAAGRTVACVQASPRKTTIIRSSAFFLCVDASAVFVQGLWVTRPNRQKNRPMPGSWAVPTPPSVPASQAMCGCACFPGRHLLGISGGVGQGGFAPDRQGTPHAWWPYGNISWFVVPGGAQETLPRLSRGWRNRMMKALPLLPAFNLLLSALPAWARRPGR